MRRIVVRRCDSRDSRDSRLQIRQFHPSIRSWRDGSRGSSSSKKPWGPRAGVEVWQAVGWEFLSEATVLPAGVMGSSSDRTHSRRCQPHPLLNTRGQVRVASRRGGRRGGRRRRLLRRLDVGLVVGGGVWRLWLFLSVSLPRLRAAGYRGCPTGVCRCRWHPD